MRADPIERYAAKASPALAAVCELLRAEIGRALPRSPARIWHAMPVWFVGENPVVGYKLAARYVNLLFWNGQTFEEQGLTAAGKFHAAQVRYTDVEQVERRALRRWLSQAATQVWDLKAWRAAARSAL